MTATAVADLAKLTGKLLTVTYRMASTGGYPIVGMGSFFKLTVNLLEIGFWYDADPADAIPQYTLQANLENEVQIVGLRYGSPLEIVMGWPGYATAASTAAFGLVKLWNKVQDARVRTARTNLIVKELTVMRERLESDLPPHLQPERLLRSYNIGADYFDRVEDVVLSDKPDGQDS